MKTASVIAALSAFTVGCGAGGFDGGGGASISTADVTNATGATSSASGVTSSGAGGVGGDPAEVLFPELALSTSGAHFVSALDGTPVVLEQAISCCGGGFGWPLVDHAWIDLAATHGIGWLHVRLGPYRTVPGGEDALADVGGPYLEVGGKADLGADNPAFWARVDDILGYAGSKGMRVEIDVADGWGMKHATWDDYGPAWPYHPWSPWNNVGGVDAITGAASGPIVPGSVADRWVRTVAKHTCRYGNVTIEDGNEIGLAPGYAASYSESVRAIYLTQCDASGYHLATSSGPVAWHPPFGTNSGDAAAVDATDYSQWHGDDPVSASSCGGKPCGVNEYNPDPPLTPDDLASRVCTARADGTWFSYWRHGQDDAAMNATLTLMQGSCR